MNSLEQRLALLKHEFTVPSVAHVLTTLGHRLAEDERNVAKPLEARLSQMYGGRQMDPHRPELDAAMDRTRDSLRYRVMSEALLNRDVTPRDVHLLLNTGREPRIPLGRIERGTLLLSIDDIVALAVIWRLSCEPFLQVKPERRKEIGRLIVPRRIDRAHRGADLSLYYLPDRTAIVGSATEEKRLGSRTLFSFCLPLTDFIKSVIEVASNQVRGESKNE